MQFSMSLTDSAQQKNDCMIVGVFANKQLSAAAKKVDQATNGQISQLLNLNDLTGDLGQTLLVYLMIGAAPQRILLVGCGEENELSESGFVKIVSKAAVALKGVDVKEVLTCLSDLKVKDKNIHWKVRQIVQVTQDNFYVFEQFKSKKMPARNLKHVLIHLEDKTELPQADLAIKEANAIVAGMFFTKDLGNLPGNICTPTYIADQAIKLGKENNKLKVTVLDKAEMQNLGMNTILAVAQGSHQPPKFIVVEYYGGKKDEQPFVLVGKGVTFDSGGISIKPAGGMEEMKYDMGGAASVLGTMQALATLQLPINVVALVPTVENMPGGGAIKPGDIIKSFAGTTVEIVNTDAEGRLILCDALTYSEKFNPVAVIDVATLTGSIVAMFGGVVTGLMSNDSKLTTEIQKAAAESYDRVWELPLMDEYQEQINSNIADIMNSGVGFNFKSSITAGCFLARFTKKLHWAHLDIAGTAWVMGKDKAATGRPVPLLTQFLIDRVKK